MTVSLSLQRILDLVGPASVSGTRETPLQGIASLGEAGAGDLSFLGNAKYKAEVATSKAGVILLPDDFEGEPAAGQVFVRLKAPSVALALVCEAVEKTLWPRPPAEIHATSVVAPDARLGPGVSVGPLAVIESGATVGEGCVIGARCVVGRQATLGRDCLLKPGVVVSDFCILGDRVRVQSGAVVGSDGFGYETISGAHRRVPQIGRVEIGDDVEIGANATIDRARFSVTRIGRGTKIDNLVQIAHNVVVGEHCMIVSQAGIAGSTTLGDHVVLGGQVGIAGHLNIGKGARVGAQAGVLADVDAGAVMLDAPAIPFGQAKKLMVLKQRLPDLFRKVDSLEKQIEALSAKPDTRQAP